jgi:DNA/RNA endonuclease YhcR with UshA esterase domain
MNSIVEIKRFTHLVIKQEDVNKYLTERKAKKFNKLIEEINRGRVKDGKGYNNYYVCNEDEPYANDVITTILHGELLKQ